MVAGFVVGAGIDIAVQLAMYGEVADPLSVGLSGASGALGVGLGSLTGKIGSIGIRAVLNAGGGAIIGGGLTFIGNILRGECDLHKNVLESMVVNGVLSGVGSFIGDKLSIKLDKFFDERATSRFLSSPLEERLKINMLSNMVNNTRRLLGPSPAPPAWGTAIGNITGTVISNVGSTVNFFNIGYYRPTEPGCACN
jgi:hypothetical protein